MNRSLVSRLKLSKKFLLATVTTAAVFGFHFPALAVSGFTGIFAPGNFTLTNTNANDSSVNTTNAASGTIVLTGGNNNSLKFGITKWKTTSAITQGGTVSFAWSFAGENFPYNGFVGDRGGYIINNIPTYLGVQDGDHGFIPSLSLTAGDTFGFTVKTANNTGVAGVLTITDFNFTPTHIPDPPTQIPEKDPIPVIIGLSFFFAGGWLKR